MPSDSSFSCIFVYLCMYVFWPIPTAEKLFDLGINTTLFDAFNSRNLASISDMFAVVFHCYRVIMRRVCRVG